MTLVYATVIIRYICHCGVHRNKQLGLPYERRCMHVEPWTLALLRHFFWLVWITLRSKCTSNLFLKKAKATTRATTAGRPWNWASRDKSSRYSALVMPTSRIFCDPSWAESRGPWARVRTVLGHSESTTWAIRVLTNLGSASWYWVRTDSTPAQSNLPKLITTHTLCKHLMNESKICFDQAARMLHLDVQHTEIQSLQFKSPNESTCGPSHRVSKSSRLVGITTRRWKIEH